MGMEPASRNTDADWQELGRSQPYWGVLTHPDFLSENITADKIEELYASGRDYIAGIVAQLERLTGARPSGRALDFGCGVGRLAEAMADYADEVNGLDISPDMLATARQRGSKVNYTSELPDGQFDWINTYIVLQHIPPDRGLQILEELLSRLAPGGMVSIQLTVWRDSRHDWDRPKGLRGIIRERAHRRFMKERPVGQIYMYDYDLSKVIRLFNLAGVAEMVLIATDHSGHRGVIILGQRTTV
jgi:SAM-dependent methyltransferase